MEPQKFKRGNLVKILTGHRTWEWNEDQTELIYTDIIPEDKDREAIIVGSYFDLYEVGFRPNNRYKIIFLDTGEPFAWKNDNELELVSEGGEYLFTLAEENRYNMGMRITRPPIFNVIDPNELDNNNIEPQIQVEVEEPVLIEPDPQIQAEFNDPVLIESEQPPLTEPNYFITNDPTPINLTPEGSDLKIAAHRTTQGKASIIAYILTILTGLPITFLLEKYNLLSTKPILFRVIWVSFATILFILDYRKRKQEK